MLKGGKLLRAVSGRRGQHFKKDCLDSAQTAKIFEGGSDTAPNVFEKIGTLNRLGEGWNKNRFPGFETEKKPMYKEISRGEAVKRPSGEMHSTRSR